MRYGTYRAYSLLQSKSIAEFDKSSAVAEMGDRGHNRHGPKRGGGAAVPLSRELGPPSNTMWPGPHCVRRGSQTPLGTSVPSGVFIRLHPSSRLATISTWAKIGWGGCALFSEGSWVHIEHNVASAPFLGREERGPHLTQSRLGRGLAPYKVTC